ncbi:MAG: hypothetical protein WBA77_10890 [Microcoleaceae cyanobacterium]
MEGCTVTDLKIHSKHNCYKLDAQTLQKLQEETAVSTQLQPGTYVIRIRSGGFNYQVNDSQSGEPLVMLWIYGGKFINKKTNITVEATWSTLNGFDDTLTLDVIETTTLCAFFFDSHLEDNEGEVTLSIVKI